MSAMPKINREHKFNQEFVEYVKVHKCIYDHTCQEYKNRELHEQAWDDISNKCGEPPDTCKKRWRNLKTSTSRYLKQLRNSKCDSSAEHKEYYLYNDMQFMIPFLRYRDDEDPRERRSIKVERNNEKKYEFELIPSDGGYIVQGPSEIESESEMENVISISKDELEEHEEESAIVDDIPPNIDDDHNSHSSGPPEKKSKIQIKESYTIQEIQTPDDTIPVLNIEQKNILSGDEMFLKSLLPDISSMTKDQKRKFKIGVLNLIDNLLSS